MQKTENRGPCKLQIYRCYYILALAHTIAPNILQMTASIDPFFSVYIDSATHDKQSELNKQSQMQTQTQFQTQTQTQPEPQPRYAFDFLPDDFYPKYIDKWVDETFVLNCQEQTCNDTFSISCRKHHCRACGCVFCHACCNKTLTIPSYINKPKQITSVTQQIKNFTKSSIISSRTIEPTKELVCNNCYDKLTKLINAEKYIPKINVAKYFDLASLYEISQIREWHSTCMFYLAKFRDIQYRPCDKLYDAWEIGILASSNTLVDGHSNWKIHIIKSGFQAYYTTYKMQQRTQTHDKIRQRDTTILEKYCTIPITTQSTDTRTNTCFKSMCSRKCKLNLDIVDFVEILKFISILDNDTNDVRNGNIFWHDRTLRQYVLKLLKNICHLTNNVNSDILCYIIPLLCSTLVSLLNAHSTDEIDESFIINIFDELIIFPDSIYLLYDEIQYRHQSASNNDNLHLGTINLLSILDNYIKKSVSKIERQVKYIRDALVQLVEYSDFALDVDGLLTGLLYPLDYNWTIIKVNSCRIMKSNSKPILLDVNIQNTISNESKNAKFLIKKDPSLRKEQLVSNTISLLIYRLKQHEKLDITTNPTLSSIITNLSNPGIPIYQIKMFTSDIGVIEFVENSITLNEINAKKYTLQNYILEHNKNIIIDIPKRNFLTSLSISCCISFLLGLADRHLDNIMVKENGQIFNIDFGYLLKDPITNVFGAPNVKITKDMIDFLGGQSSEYYKQFSDYLEYVYDIMRLYKNIAINYYEIIEVEIKGELLKEKLESRFMPGMKKKDIKITLISEINSSSASYSSLFNDSIHTIGSFFNTFLQ